MTFYEACGLIYRHELICDAKIISPGVAKHTGERNFAEISKGRIWVGTTTFASFYVLLILMILFWTDFPPNSICSI